jgi:glutamyl/glutaminyl-tRNA synthetase
VADKKAQGLAHTLRFRTPAKEVVVEDMVQGTVRFDTALIGDFIIVKSDGYASYNYAVVVDDHLMDITHVIRGVGHLSNTPRQVLIYEAFGWKVPAWAHVSEIVGSDHKKLSKRHGATPITAFRDLGYTARAFNNYMALLGWSSPDAANTCRSPNRNRSLTLRAAASRRQCSMSLILPKRQKSTSRRFQLPSLRLICFPNRS